jgi:hypothetical protein
MGGMKKSYKVWLEKLKGKPLARPRSRWEDNIRMNLREIRWEGVDSIHVVQNKDQWRAFVNTVLNLHVP